MLLPQMLRPLAVVFAIALTPSLVGAGGGSIEDPTGRASLEVNFRFAPTYQEVAETQAALTRMASLICDATEGQVRLRRVRMTTGEVDKDLAGFWIHSSATRSGGAYFPDGSGLEMLGSHMDVFPGELLRPDRLAHLFAHHAFGLGDQYAEQRREGSACGFGEGFANDKMNERQHSLMQLSGGLSCLSGPREDEVCLRHEDCPASSCDAMLASEFSTKGRHDPLRGAGGACPSPQPLARVQLRGLLPATAGPITAFDPSDYLSARATSSFQATVEAVDGRSAGPARRLLLYLTHVDKKSWQLSAGIDGGSISGTRGELVILKTWTLLFNDDGSLGVIEDAPTTVSIPDAGRGDSDLVIAIDVGTPNPNAATDPGVGFDGLQLTKAGPVDVKVMNDGLAGCTAKWCSQAWNIETSAWEATAQTILHGGESDWETIVKNRPYLRAPDGLPESLPPAVCRTPPQFVHDIAGADQVLLVLDHSQTMGSAAVPGVHEVCENKLDDDQDGEIDEAPCSDTRLALQSSAVSLLLAMLDGSGMHVGGLAFSTDQEDLLPLGPLTPDAAKALADKVAALEPAADTAMGEALEAAHERFDATATLGRSRTAILFSDGANNLGVDPEDVDQPFDGPVVRWHTIGIGGAADLETLASIATKTSGLAMATSEAGELPLLAAALAARLRGYGTVLPRQRFVLDRSVRGEATGASRSKPGKSAVFDIDVEEGARELVLSLVSAANSHAQWKVLFELRGPDGTRYDERSAQAVLHPSWALLRITDPQPGTWRFRVLPDAEGVQESAIAAFLNNPRADFFVDAKATLTDERYLLRVGASPSFMTALDGPLVVDALVRAPKGEAQALELRRDPITRGIQGESGRIDSRGLYEIRASVDVGSGVEAAAGEAPFDGLPRERVRVPSFRRYASATAYVADAPWPKCSVADCDGDGISNLKENACGEDIDGDGIPGRYDEDADNDEVLDRLEASGDEDGDGIVNYCDPRDAPSSLRPILEDDQEAIRLACSDEPLRSVEHLSASISGLRRVVQSVKVAVKAGKDKQKQLVEDLDEALRLKKKALMIADVLPDFCLNYQAALESALGVEEEVAIDVAAILTP